MPRSSRATAIASSGAPAATSSSRVRSCPRSSAATARATRSWRSGTACPSSRRSGIEARRSCSCITFMPRCGRWCSATSDRGRRRSATPSSAASRRSRYRRTPIVTLSSSSKDDIVDQLHLPAAQRRSRAAGDRPDVHARGRRKAPDPCLVAVGRLVPVKRYDHLIRAVAEARRRHPRLVAHDRRRRLRARAARRAARRARRTERGSRSPGGSRTTTWSRCTAGRGWWSSASAREGWGMSLTEAAACGTPGGRDAHPRSPRRRRRRQDRGARRSADVEALRRAPSPSWSPTTTRRARLRRGRVGQRRLVHVGGDGDRHHATRSPPRPTAAAVEARRSEGRGAPTVAATLAARRARWCLLRPAAPHGAGTGRRRHQDVPLPRPGTAAVAGVVDVGPEHRPRNRHPPEHRLPVPDGAVLLGGRAARRARSGWRSGSGSARSCSSPARASGSCCARCGWRRCPRRSRRSPTRSRRTC